MTRATIVILGAGMGGVIAAFELCHALGERARIVVVSKGEAPTHEATWNAICLADFGDGGAAFMAQPQIPPRNINWSASGRWVHTAKAAFERYFLHKVRTGQAEPLYERLALDLIGARKVREATPPPLSESGS